MLGDWWTRSHSDAAWLIVIDRWALLAALVLPSLMHLVSCLACWRCCYYFVLLLAVRLLSCARGPYTYIHTYIRVCIIIILALPVWRPRWRAARPLLWLSSPPCLLTAARMERGLARRHQAHLDATAITTSPSHHSYAKVCSHLHG